MTAGHCDQLHKVNCEEFELLDAAKGRMGTTLLKIDIAILENVNFTIHFCLVFDSKIDDYERCLKCFSVCLSLSLVFV